MFNSELMFLDGRLLMAFCAAAEELHFGRAAARLFMSQPPLSKQIKRLEKLVGAELFTRTTRTVRLTPAGEIMYGKARAVCGSIEDMLRATRKAARGEVGSLSIGLTPSAACSPLAADLYDYRVANPEIELELLEMNSVEMEAALSRRRVDVALMRPWPPESSLDMHEIYEEPMLLALRRDHPLGKRHSVRLKDVVNYPIVGYEPNVSPYFNQMLQSMFAYAKLKPQIVQRSVIPTLVTLVEAGVGPAIVPRSMSRPGSKTVKFLPIAESDEFNAKMVVATLAGNINPAVGRFIKSMQSWRQDSC
jgi:DNA-binding transcriptional LysR family regulator